MMGRFLARSNSDFSICTSSLMFQKPVLCCRWSGKQQEDQVDVLKLFSQLACVVLARRCHFKMNHKHFWSNLMLSCELFAIAYFFLPCLILHLLVRRQRLLVPSEASATGVQVVLLCSQFSLLERRPASGGSPAVVCQRRGKKRQLTISS